MATAKKPTAAESKAAAAAAGSETAEDLTQTEAAGTGAPEVEPTETPESELAEAPDEGGDRIEFYDARRPGGKIVRVKHNIDAGTTEIVD